MKKPLAKGAPETSSPWTLIWGWHSVVAALGANNPGVACVIVGSRASGQKLETHLRAQGISTEIFSPNQNRDCCGEKAFGRHRAPKDARKPAANHADCDPGQGLFEVFTPSCWRQRLSITHIERLWRKRKYPERLSIFVGCVEESDSDVVSQSIWALVHLSPPVPLEDLNPEKGPVLVLDHVQDPHNVGALWRSAAALGAQAIVLTKHHSPDITGTVMKSASGACMHTPYVLIVNMVRALNTLKSKGFTVVGLSDCGTLAVQGLASMSGVACVVGAEGSGLRRLTKETCDILAHIPCDPNFGVLNASAAGAIALSYLSPWAKS